MSLSWLMKNIQPHRFPIDGRVGSQAYCRHDSLWEDSQTICYSVEIKYPPRAHMFKQSVSTWWCYFRRLWNLLLKGLSRKHKDITLEFIGYSLDPANASDSSSTEMWASHAALSEHWAIPSTLLNAPSPLWWTASLPNHEPKELIPSLNCFSIYLTTSMKIVTVIYGWTTLISSGLWC